MRRLILLFASVALVACDLSFTGPVKISSVTIDPAEATVAENEAVLFTAVVRDALGNAVDEQPVWSTQDYSVVTPDYMSNVSGKFVATSVGTAIIEATLRGKTGRAKLTVTAAPIGQVVAYPVEQTILQGQSYYISYILYDKNGRFLRPRPAIFTSSNPSVASTGIGNQVTGVAPGTASIVVTVEDKADTVLVKVMSR